MMVQEVVILSLLAGLDGDSRSRWKRLRWVLRCVALRYQMGDGWDTAARVVVVSSSHTTSYFFASLFNRERNIRLKVECMPKLWGWFALGLDPTKTVESFLPKKEKIWGGCFLFVRCSTVGRLKALAIPSRSS